MVGINVFSQDIQRWDLPEPSLIEADFTRIKAWGFDTVQIGQNWALIEPTSGAYDEDYLQKLDLVVDRIKAAGLKCVLRIGLSDYFASHGGWISFESLWSDFAVQERFYSLWEMLVTRYTGKISACAILNEPKPQSNSGPWTDAERQIVVDNWNRGLVSDLCIARIRILKPAMKIIINYGPWGSPANYANASPRPFSNIVYAFSWYSPTDVTFRGADWTETQDYVTSRISAALTFRSTYNVTLLCQELGINVSDYPITDSRLKWIDDSLKVLNSERIEWFYWLYAHWVNSDFSVIDAAGISLETVNVLLMNPAPKSSMGGLVLLLLIIADVLGIS